MASRGIPLNNAAIFSTTMEGILYGFSVLMFIGTMWALTYRHRKNKIHRPNVVVACMLLILSTAHMIVDFIRVEQGLVTYRNTFPGGPSAFFADVSQITFVVKNIIYNLQTMLGDGIVIYRCYVVWKSVWVIIVPSLLWFGMAVSGFGAVYSFSKATSDAGDIFAKSTGPWITTFYAMTLGSNLSASGLLAYRIWRMECDVSALRATKSSSMMPIVRVLADSAILYSVTLLSALICFVEANNGQYVVVDMITPIISITFYMIIIRIAMKKTTPSHSSLSTIRMADEIARETQQRYNVKCTPVEVHITQITHQDDNDACKPAY
ncbi:uncharacterized protein F5891DRAFT_1192923 [Suillus fuscotomentosus]|uniref:Uncharacterized protein n=1 Tax=Suillus fuscotomentosus TaxID=1912939 RepID=A0AAD4DYR8_9AGAM|nr:uncharacterized protein F5891DRAFT_1192923 [Suillus fuscotomentosus]KAG1896574.1 hypothetical protein F5891DRAFT_1192923 [Suillus fuscotomentosus]